jgi:hypothetical protein
VQRGPSRSCSEAQHNYGHRICQSARPHRRQRIQGAGSTFATICVDDSERKQHPTQQARARHTPPEFSSSSLPPSLLPVLTTPRQPGAKARTAVHPNRTVGTPTSSLHARSIQDGPQGERAAIEGKGPAATQSGPGHISRACRCARSRPCSTAPAPAGEAWRCARGGLGFEEDHQAGRRPESQLCGTTHSSSLQQAPGR